MNAKSEIIPTTIPLAAECAKLRRHLAAVIRGRLGLAPEERAWFAQHGLHFSSDSDEVGWKPSPGESGDLATERRHLLCAVHLLTGPIEPITAEELAEALASG